MWATNADPWAETFGDHVVGYVPSSPGPPVENWGP